MIRNFPLLITWHDFYLFEFHWLHETIHVSFKTTSTKMALNVIIYCATVCIKIVAVFIKTMRVTFVYIKFWHHDDYIWSCFVDLDAANVYNLLWHILSNSFNNYLDIFIQSFLFIDKKIKFDMKKARNAAAYSI